MVRERYRRTPTPECVTLSHSSRIRARRGLRSACLIGGGVDKSRDRLPERLRVSSLERASDTILAPAVARLLTDCWARGFSRIDSEPTSRELRQLTSSRLPKGLEPSALSAARSPDEHRHIHRLGRHGARGNDRRPIALASRGGRAARTGSSRPVGLFYRRRRRGGGGDRRSDHSARRRHARRQGRGMRSLHRSATRGPLWPAGGPLRPAAVSQGHEAARSARRSRARPSDTGRAWPRSIDIAAPTMAARLSSNSPTPRRTRF